VEVNTLLHTKTGLQWIVDPPTAVTWRCNHRIRSDGDRFNQKMLDIDLHHYQGRLVAQLFRISCDLEDKGPR